MSIFEAFQVVILKCDDIGEAKKFIEFEQTCCFMGTQKVRKQGKSQASGSAYSLSPCPVGFGRNAFHSDKELAEAGLVGKVKALGDSCQAEVGGLE